MKKYVLGFAFDHKKQIVVLIEKQKPDWQKGRYNGVGGKVEPYDDSPLDAMVREFEEETGLKTIAPMWKQFATMIFKDDIMGGEAQVYCFRMFNSDIHKCKSMENEQIKRFHCLPELFEVSDFQSWKVQPLISNLHVLIPMAMDENFTFCELNLK